MTDTTTAQTPGELAKKLDHMSDISLLYSPNDAVDLGDEAAAMIRAQAVKIAELTAERDRWVADWRGEKAEAERLDEHAGALECSLEHMRAALAASQARETAMREALTVAYDLSTWAACINWRARNKDNQGEWLDELKDLITRTQQLVEPLIKPLPAALQPQEPANG
ncbi:hypothetical protein ABNQ39_20945 [Azospirillum sp. A26]|uniref:hypothetical protein n=1 Tax=Azospirillum sp. A26 TaxID=3160607 RepID=UPI00366C1083